MRRFSICCAVGIALGRDEGVERTIQAFEVELAAFADHIRKNARR
jgi:hypothetical protein